MSRAASAPSPSANRSHCSRSQIGPSNQIRPSQAKVIIEECQKSEKRELTSSVHVPRGFSPQVCVVINGHLTNPSCRSSSLGLLLRIMDLRVTKLGDGRLTLNRASGLGLGREKGTGPYLVPMGELRNTSTSPRRVEFSVITACTCSR